MSAATTLAQARTNLMEAEQALAKENRKQAEQACRAAITEGRKFKDEYEALRREFSSAEGEVMQARGKLAVANDQIARYYAAKPSVLDFPSPEEEQAWERRKNKLTAARDRIAKELEPKSTACEQLRMAAPQSQYARFSLPLESE